MQKLGIKCGPEFDLFSGYSFISGGRVWNYCKLDGEYYYFDSTWDDTTFDGDSLKPCIDYSHMYFGNTGRCRRFIERTETLYNID